MENTLFSKKDYSEKIIYYSSEKKKNEQLKELEKIKKYGETMKQFTGDKNN